MRPSRGSFSASASDMISTFRLATPTATGRVWFFGFGIALTGALNLLHRGYADSAAGVRFVCRSSNFILLVFAAVAGAITGATIVQQIVLLSVVGAALIRSCHPDT